MGGSLHWVLALRILLRAGVGKASCACECGEYASNHAPTSERDDLGCLPGTPRLVRIVLGSAW